MHSPIIYICEDDAFLGQNILSLLQEEGYQASWFYEGTGLAEAISSQLPDVLLMDVQLPGEDGLTLAQRYSDAIPSVRIIMMSVNSSDAMRHKGYRAGAMMYLPKPFEPAALLACLQGLFTKPQEQQAAILYLKTSTLAIDAVQVNLTYSEVVILRELSLAGGEVIEYYHLMESLDLTQDDISKAGLEVLVSRLRKKLTPFTEYVEIHIKNKQKVGYYLLGKVTLKAL
jgi:two-component system phosphate regulon response regulator OmpR